MSKDDTGIPATEMREVSILLAQLKSNSRDVKRVDNRRKELTYTLAGILRSRRKKLNIQLVEMAKALDISPGYMSDIEQGNRNLTDEIAEKYINHLIKIEG